MPGINATTVKENGIKYEKDIEKYDEKIRSYAETWQMILQKN